MGRDTVQLETTVSTISQEYLLEFTFEYDIPEFSHPELPGPKDTIVDFPEGKVGAYTKFFEYANFRISLSQSFFKFSVITQFICQNYMDLFNLISAPNPTKVKIGLRLRAAHEVPLLTATASRVIDMEDPDAATESYGTSSTIEKSPLDFNNENPSQQITEGAIPEAGAEEEIAAMGSLLSKKRRKRGNDEADENAPPKMLRKDHAASRPTQNLPVKQPSREIQILRSLPPSPPLLDRQAIYISRVRLIVPTPHPSSIAQPSSPSQQQQPSQPTTIFMDRLNNLLETCTALTRRVENLGQDKIAQALEITKLKKRVRKLENKKKLRVSGLKRLRKVGTTQRIESSADTVMDDQEDASKQGEIIANIDADEGITLKDVVAIVKEVEVLSVHDDVEESAELQEVIEVVTTAKLMTEVVTAAPRIMVEEPEPLKKQARIEQDEAYARELEAELNKNINWDDVIESPSQKEYDCLSVEYGWIQDGLFKGMSYDDIRPIFEKYFNSNVGFLEKSKEQLEEEESIALKRQRESLKEKTTKKQKLDEEVEELKKHLQIVTNDDDDVYTEATPLALKVPVVDYEIYLENNKPFYKIIRADGSH
nr:hypothetical protein [Tanacetum cinerariifolium]